MLHTPDTVATTSTTPDLQHEVSIPKDTEYWKSRPKPWNMPSQPFIAEFDKVMASVKAKEKQGGLDPAHTHDDEIPYKPLDDEETQLHTTDWQAFSRKRGFSENDIAEYGRWRLLSGQEHDLPGAINDPWRRLRAHWPATMYIRHIEAAIQRGDEIPPPILESYTELKSQIYSLSRISRAQTLQDVVVPSSSTDIDDVW